MRKLVVGKTKRLFSNKLESLQFRLAHPEALLSLSFFGLISGCLAAVVILLLRWSIEFVQITFLPENRIDNYEQLVHWMRFVLPVLGALIIAFVTLRVRPETLNVGIVHVWSRLAYHQGRLPVKNAIYQFFGACISILCGHSVGREGPSAHLGAATASLLGQAMRLPNNSIRTLVACGTAGAIAASFNTPLAAVVFAMEIIMMEYSIIGFTPVIVAAMSAAAVSRLVYGTDLIINIPALSMDTFFDLPLIIVMGLIIGILAALFITSLSAVTAATQQWRIAIRLILAGLFTGIIAVFVPEIMGLGYDTLDNALTASSSITLMLVVVIAKLLATTVGIGLGLPGGLIGPTLVIGACAGEVIGVAVGILFPEQTSAPGFYALLGMGAMMAATLQAPLSALTAMLELTGNLNIVMPGMLAIVCADLTASQFFGKASIFLQLLRLRGLDYRPNPNEQLLRKIGVTAAMERKFACLPKQCSVASCKQALIENQPIWIIVLNEDEPIGLLLPADLVSFCNEQDNNIDIDLLDIPGERFQIAPITFEADLQEACDMLEQDDVEALYIQRFTKVGRRIIYGILTPLEIENSYLPKPGN